ATHVLSPRPSDHLAAASADGGARLGGTLEMGDPPAHENGAAPADGDSAVEHFICPSMESTRAANSIVTLPLVGRVGAKRRGRREAPGWGSCGDPLTDPHPNPSPQGSDFQMRRRKYLALSQSVTWHEQEPSEHRLHIGSSSSAGARRAKGRRGQKRNCPLTAK